MEKRLPIFATLDVAIDLTRSNFGYALKIMAPWFLLVLFVPNLIFYFSGSPSDADAAEQFKLWELVDDLLYFFGWSAIAVLWHWRILRDNSRSHLVITLDRRVWLYALWFFMICLVIVVIIGIAVAFFFFIRFFAASLDGLAVNFADITVVLTLPIMFTILARLPIALPAIALDNFDLGLVEAWQVTKGNTLRLIAVLILPMLPLIIANVIIESIQTGVVESYSLSPPSLFLQLLSQSIDFAIALLALTILSICYAFFVEDRSSEDESAKGLTPSS